MSSTVEEVKKLGKKVWLVRNRIEKENENQLLMTPFAILLFRMTHFSGKLKWIHYAGLIN